MKMKQTALIFRLVSCIQVALFFCYQDVAAQNDIKSDTIQLSTIRIAQRIRPYVKWVTAPKNEITPSRLSTLSFIDTIPLKFAASVPPELVEKEVFMKFM